MPLPVVCMRSDCMAIVDQMVNQGMLMLRKRTTRLNHAKQHLTLYAIRCECKLVQGATLNTYVTLIEVDFNIGLWKQEIDMCLSNFNLWYAYYVVRFHAVMMCLFCFLVLFLISMLKQTHQNEFECAPCYRSHNISQYILMDLLMWNQPGTSVTNKIDQTSVEYMD